MTYQLVHEKTGARLFHVDCSDTNNVFCVTFKTVPTDSTGVAHILEHTTLCGSEKYPVRDPFFNMLKRSLNTYMNAYTAPDHTSYPFSTQNVKDYYNLLSVYLDATFFPKLEPFDFMQEGHRLEFEKIDDPSSALKFKGVVYNEMKGAMSEGDSIFYQALHSNLFSKTTYKNNSGGEPKAIPDLTYDQLIEFHRSHYHPSNAWFYTYGDLSLEHRLQQINENVLSRFSQIDPGTGLPDEVRLTQPKRVEAVYPPVAGSDPKRQEKFTVAWLTNKTTDPFENMSMNLLSRLLLNGPNAPMYKVLIDTNIGLDYAPSTGYDSGAREAPFAIGLSGMNEKDVPKVEEGIMSTLKQVAAEGFPEERIQSVLHQIELSQKHVTTDFGMSVGHAINYTWIHGADPAEVLSVNKKIERLKQELEAGPYFQHKVKQYFLDNPHMVSLLMKPDEKYLEKLDKEEQARLEKIRASLSQAEIDDIIAKAKFLKERQEQQQNVSILPTLHVSDVPREAPNKDTRFERKTIPLAHSAHQIPLLSVPQPTNGLTYFRGMASLNSLPSDLVPYVPLFCSAMASMGAGSMDYRQLAQKIESHTGGIEFSPVCSTHHSDLSKFRAGIYVSSFCLDRNLDHMFELLHTVLSAPRFEDVERLKSIIYGNTSDMQESLVESGHSYARSLAASVFSRASALHETWSGISQVTLMQQLAQSEDVSTVIPHLKAIAEHVLDASLMRCSIVGEEGSLPQAEQKLTHLLGGLKSSSSAQPTAAADYRESEYAPLSRPHRLFVPIPAQVNFVSQILPTVPFTHPDFPKLKALSSLVSSSYLHPEIREKGGAYGSGAMSGEGLWSFYSFRDPNTTKTLDVFSSLREWMKKDGAFQDKDIDEAKLRLFSSIDHPVAPSRQGALEFTSGITWEMRQKNREGILDATRKDLIEMAEKYLVPATSSTSQDGGRYPSIAILGNTAHNPFTAEETLNLGLNNSNAGIIEEGDEGSDDDDSDNDEEHGQRA